MKKTLFAIAILFAINCSAQEKKDTTIQITLHIDQYRAVLYAIDQNVDSKSLSKQLIDLLNKNAQIADKPKETIKK